METRKKKELKVETEKKKRKWRLWTNISRKILQINIRRSHKKNYDEEW